jgi:hypothetical protein
MSRGAPSPPGTRIDGEHTLRWLVPSGLAQINLVGRHLLLYVSLLGGPLWALMALPCVLLAWFSPAAGLALGMFAAVPALTIGFLVGLWRRPRPVLWWVTTRRLVVRKGSEVREVLVFDITGLDADVQLDKLTVTSSEGSWSVGPVQALPELWGAVAFAHAWDAPDFEVFPKLQGSGTLWWGQVRKGLTTTRGLLALRPGQISWIPDQVTQSGARMAADLAAALMRTRIRRAAPVPPLDTFGWLVQRAKDPNLIDVEVGRVVQQWGGWTVDPAKATWRIAGDGHVVSMVVEHDGSTYSAAGLPRDVAVSVSQGWTQA